MFMKKAKFASWNPDDKIAIGGWEMISGGVHREINLQDEESARYVL